MLAGRMHCVTKLCVWAQVAAELGVVHRLGVLEPAELRRGVQQHHDEDEQEVEADLDETQADAHVDVVDEVLDLGFKRFGHTCLSDTPPDADMANHTQE